MQVVVHMGVSVVRLVSARMTEGEISRVGRALAVCRVGPDFLIFRDRSCFLGKDWDIRENSK